MFYSYNMNYGSKNRVYYYCLLRIVERKIEIKSSNVNNNKTNK